MRITFREDGKLRDEMGKLDKRAAEMFVGIVEREFVELLKNSPQRSGNYVANFAVAAGGALGRKGPNTPFPEKPTNAQIVRRGSIAAINFAKEQNANLKANLTKHISRGSGGWLPQLTVYNKIDYAGMVEGYSVEQLRKDNKPGVHAFTKFTAKLQSALNVHIVYGSNEFNTLADIRLL